MRSIDKRPSRLFSCVNLEDRVPSGHPLRAMRDLVNPVLLALDASFAALYRDGGRPSITPKRLLPAIMLQLLYSIRSEGQLMERLDFDLRFRWFVGFDADDAVLDAVAFSKNQMRVLTLEIAQGCLPALQSDRRVKRLLSAEHFSVDGTMLKAFATMKSLRAKNCFGNPADGGRNGERNFRHEKRTNETHTYTSDPDARLYSKASGEESRLAYLGYALTENNNGLAVAPAVTHATGTAEREAALETAGALPEGATLGADKAYDVEAFVTDLKTRNIVPHVAINGTFSKTSKVRKTAVPDDVAASDGFAISLRCRKRIENIFGWGKTTAGFYQLKVRGIDKIWIPFTFALAA